MNETYFSKDYVTKKIDKDLLIEKVMSIIEYYANLDFEDTYDSINIITSPETALKVLAEILQKDDYNILSIDYNLSSIDYVSGLNTKITSASMCNIVLYPGRNIALEPVYNENGKVYNIFDSLIFLDSIHIPENKNLLIDEFKKLGNDLAVIEDASDDTEDNDEVLIQYTDIVADGNGYKCAITAKSSEKESLQGLIDILIEISKIL